MKKRRLRWLGHVLRIKNGELQNTSSGYTVGTEGLQEKAGMVKQKLNGHCQTRSEGHGHYLG